MWPSEASSHRFSAFSSELSIAGQVARSADLSTGRTPASKPKVHFLLSFPALLAVLLIVVAIFTVRGRFNDPDLWWHLKTGEVIWNTHAIPRMDPFSFTANGQAWIVQEWLAELSIYAAYELGGYSGLMLWLCVLASLLLIAGYALCWLYSRNCKIAFLGAMGIWYFATVGFSIRPQMVGYLLLLCELAILRLGRDRNPRWFLVLPPLFALWINCHSSFVFGWIVFAVVLACSFLEFRAGLLISMRWKNRSRTALAVSFVISTAALFINPIGPKLIWYPFDVMFRQPLNLGIVGEWHPAPFSDIRAWALPALAMLVVLIPLLKRIELRLEDLILVGLGFCLAVQHRRMLFVFGILAAPVLCRLFADNWRSYESEREHPLVNACLIAMAALAIGLGFPSSQSLAAQVSRTNPVKALAFLDRSSYSGRMLNEYLYGGYLIWAEPGRKVFIDGRADLYEPVGVLADYVKFMKLSGEPQSILGKYRIDLCLLSRDNPMCRVLLLLPGWKKVYSDERASLFARES